MTRLRHTLIVLATLCFLGGFAGGSRALFAQPEVAGTGRLQEATGTLNPDDWDGALERVPQKSKRDALLLQSVTDYAKNPDAGLNGLSAKERAAAIEKRRGEIVQALANVRSEAGLTAAAALLRAVRPEPKDLPTEGMSWASLAPFALALSVLLALCSAAFMTVAVMKERTIRAHGESSQAALKGLAGRLEALQTNLNSLAGPVVETKQKIEDIRDKIDKFRTKVASEASADRPPAGKAALPVVAAAPAQPNVAPQATIQPREQASIFNSSVPSLPAGGKVESPPAPARTADFLGLVADLQRQSPASARQMRFDKGGKCLVDGNGTPDARYLVFTNSTGNPCVLPNMEEAASSLELYAFEDLFEVEGSRPGAITVARQPRLEAVKSGYRVVAKGCLVLGLPA